MADFVAVLKKTLSGLENPTAEMREKVYAKARTTITAKLEAISPPPPAGVIDRQKEALERAIVDVEASYTQSSASPVAEEDPLAEFVSGKAFGTTLAPAPTITPAEPAAAETTEAIPEPAEREPVAQPVAAETKAAEPTSNQPPPPIDPNQVPKPKKRGGAGLIAAVIVLLLLAGAGYAVWQNKEDFARMAGLEHLLPGASENAVPDDQQAASQSDETESETQEQSANGETEDINAGTGTEDEPKFTQRLMEDGSEVDAGPAGGEESIGEGTSVAASTTTGEDGTETTEQQGEQTVAAADPDATGESSEQTGAEAPEGTVLPVGQRAIFYEERTTDLQGSAEAGAVVWSLVQESPGGNLPPEAAIRAEASIPGKEMQFRMTIRRNGDKSLPASHIIEMIFITPDDFEGGGIENVLRITFKDSEQSAGNPLLGIPAKISDGFFLLALTDSKADIEANSTMMRRLDWLDVPIVYSSGRRALITMEKGVPGSKIFEEALKAWAPESSG